MTKPILKDRELNISIAKFKDKDNRVNYVVQKSYKDKNDEWVNMKLSFFPTELLALRIILNRLEK